MEEIIKKKIFFDLSLEELYHILAFIGIIIIIFRAIREIICWYFKINKRVEIQSEILKQLENINNKLITQAVNISPTQEGSLKDLVNVDTQEDVYFKEGRLYNRHGEIIDVEKAEPEPPK